MTERPKRSASQQSKYTRRRVCQQISVSTAQSYLGSDHDVKAPQQNITILFVTPRGRELPADTLGRGSRVSPHHRPKMSADTLGRRTFWDGGRHNGTLYRPIMFTDTLGRSVTLGPKKGPAGSYNDLDNTNMRLPV